MGYSPWGRKESDTTERLHFTRTQELELLSAHAAATESICSKACAPQQGKSPQLEAHAPQLRSSPHLLQLGKSPGSHENPV